MLLPWIISLSEPTLLDPLFAAAPNLTCLHLQGGPTPYPANLVQLAPRLERLYLNCPLQASEHRTGSLSPEAFFPACTNLKSLYLSQMGDKEPCRIVGLITSPLVVLQLGHPSETEASWLSRVPINAVLMMPVVRSVRRIRIASLERVPEDVSRGWRRTCEGRGTELCGTQRFFTGRSTVNPSP